MPKAKKLPSGNFRALIYTGKDSNGKRQYKSFTDPDKKKAEYAAAEYALKRKKENSARNLTFQDASDRYIKNNSNVLSPASIRGYRIMQRNAYPLLLSATMGKLSTDDLIQKQMNENAKSYSAKSLSNQLKFITAVMRYFDFATGKIVLKPSDGHGIAVPTEKEAEKIMELLKTAPDIECQALLALTCSLRQSEIAGLTVDSIDENCVRIHGACVPNEKNKLVYKETNKSTAGSRTVVMPQYLADKMAKICLEVKSGKLFQFTPTQILYRFKKLLVSNGLPPYTIHSLRHCFAAIMHAQNVPDKYVMEMGGWASNYVLKKVYQYTFEDESQKAKQVANQYFDNTLSGKNATRNATRPKIKSVIKRSNK